MSPVKILVTGGTGFLGRHLLRAARAGGHAVTIVSRNPSRVPELADQATLVAGDVREGVSLVDTFAAAAPDAVIHAAAIVDHRDPDLLAVNVGGTAEVVAAARALSTPPRLVYVSSFAVEDPPPTEYSRSKEAAEAVVTGQDDVPWVIVRPTLIYGPDDGGTTPALVEALKSGVHALPGGGTARISPVHVDDVAAALVAACERDDVEGGRYRLGSADGISVRDYRAAVRDTTGGRARFVTLPLGLLGAAGAALRMLGKPGVSRVVAFHRHGDHVVDNTDAIADLGYAPRTVRDGVADAFES